MAVKQTKAVSVVLPLGLYQRVEQLALKSRMSIHAYLVRMVWRETKWKSEVSPTTNNPLKSDSGVSGEVSK
jgi:hypothetical protein